MKYSEKWGKDVDEAVRLALEDLGATEDQIQVTVIEEPSKGFLGLGAKLAKVRVDLIEEEPAQSKSKKSNKRNESKQGGNHNHKRDLRKKDKNPNKQERQEINQNGNKKENYPPIDLSDKPTLSEKPSDLVADPDGEAAVFLNTLIEKMEIDVVMEASKNDDCYYVEISGKDSRMVIGKRGQTLDSIQYLTNLVVNKDREQYKRTIIDVEGYRSRREKTLEQLGAKLARKVQKTGRSVKLEPMNPYERKVIHSTLQGIEGITTRSEGEEPYRRVIVEKK